MKTERKWTNKMLMEEFHRVNRLYFQDSLPHPINLAFAHIDGLGHTFRYRTIGRRRSDSDPFGIHISTELRSSRRLWLTTLIHEMVHLEQRCKYGCGIRGRRFNARMRKLALDGAFDGLW